MKKIQLLGVALVALCALSAFISSSAFALEFELAQWLANGVKIATALASTTKGGLLLENKKSGGSILCEGIFDGTTGPESADEVTAVLNTSGTQIAELDESAAKEGISCTGTKICETGSEIWPLNLPFLTELELDKTSPPELFFDLFVANGAGKLPGYSILCLFLGANIEELCEAAANSGSEVLNVTGGVEGMGTAEPLGECGGEPGVAATTADAGNLTALSGTGGTLTASE